MLVNQLLLDSSKWLKWFAQDYMYWIIRMVPYDCIWHYIRVHLLGKELGLMQTLKHLPNFEAAMVSWIANQPFPWFQADVRRSIEVPQCLVQINPQSCRVASPFRLQWQRRMRNFSGETAMVCSLLSDIRKRWVFSPKGWVFLPEMQMNQISFASFCSQSARHLASIHLVSGGVSKMARSPD